MNLTKSSLLFIALALGTAINSLPSRAEPSLGRLLYETHCGSCHNQSVHSREFRVAQSYSEIQTQVRRWSTYVGADWSPKDVGEVTDYLNSRFYRFECQEKECNKAGAQTDASVAIGVR